MDHLPQRQAEIQQIDEASSLAAYQWQKRVILLFGQQGDPAFQAQRAALAQDPKALAERDIVILESDDPALRARQGAPAHGFAALLLGKDGGVKLRSAHPLTIAEIRTTVDAMPMRRAERAARSDRPGYQAPVPGYPAAPGPGYPAAPAKE